MTHRERIMAVFKGERPDKTPWMPRLEHWYNVNQALSTLPNEYHGLGLLDIYKDIDAAMRLYTIFSDSMYGFRPSYFLYKGVGRQPVQPYPAPVSTRFEEDIKITVKKLKNFVISSYKTPIGALTSKAKVSEHGMAWYPVEYPVKDARDLKVMAFILENTKVEFDAKAFQDWERWLSGHGMHWYQCSHVSPLQRLIIQYMGLERTIATLYRHPSEMEEFMNVVKETDDQYYNVIGNSPFEVVNLGGNIECRFVSPTLFRKYYLPYWQERNAQLHRKGKYVIYHVDGWAKPILPLFKEGGFDGIEALTVKPVGDMTLEDIKKVLGDKMVYVDGLPFNSFLPETSLKEFEEFTRKIIRMFPNNLVLGISDEMPPPGEVRKLRLVSKIVDEEKSKS